MVKNPTANAGDMGSIPSPGISHNFLRATKPVLHKRNHCSEKPKHLTQPEKSLHSNRLSAVKINKQKTILLIYSRETRESVFSNKLLNW